MFIQRYFIALMTFLAIDMIWLAFIAKNFYQKHIGFLMTPNINWTAAILFYLLFVVGIVIFVVTPAINSKSWTYALIYGALFGLVTYATYDLTNLATIKGWPVLITIIDMIWGMSLSALVSVVSFFIIKRFG